MFFRSEQGYHLYSFLLHGLLCSLPLDFIFWLSWCPGAVWMWSVRWNRDPWGISVSIRLHQRPHTTKHDGGNHHSSSKWYAYAFPCPYVAKLGTRSRKYFCACMNHHHFSRIIFTQKYLCMQNPGASESGWCRGPDVCSWCGSDACYRPQQGSALGGGQVKNREKLHHDCLCSSLKLCFSYS